MCSDATPYCSRNEEDERGDCCKSKPRLHCDGPPFTWPRCCETLTGQEYVSEDGEYSYHHAAPYGGKPAARQGSIGDVKRRTQEPSKPKWTSRPPHPPDNRDQRRQFDDEDAQSQEYALGLASHWVGTDE